MTHQGLDGSDLLFVGGIGRMGEQDAVDSLVAGVVQLSPAKIDCRRRSDDTSQKDIN